MKVLMLAEGGKGIGLGHVSRCLAIRRAFAEQGTTPDLMVRGDNGLSRMSKDEGFVVMDWLHDAEKTFAIAKGVDIVLIDSYIAGPEFYAKLSRAVRLPVYLDDYLRIIYPGGVVVNGAILAEGLDYPRRRDVEYLLGVDYFPLRKEFWEAPPLRIRERVESIMITFGGMDSAGMTPLILSCLAEHVHEVRKTVVIGKWFKNVPGIGKAGDRNTDFVYSPSADGMREIMLSSDLAISSGGQTLYELAKIGLPTIAVAEADNQLSNLRGWEKAGFIFYAGGCADKGVVESVLVGLQCLKSQEARMGRSLVGIKSMDGKGARRLVSKLLEILRTHDQGNRT